MSPQYSPAKFSHDVDINRLATHPDRDYARIPVDIAQTGQTLGHTFRLAREIILASGASLWWKFSSPINFNLQEQFFTGDEGFFIFKVYAGDNVTPSGVFNVPVPMFGKNRSTERPLPLYEQQTQVLAGGTATVIDPNLYVDVARIKSANATAQQTTVGVGISSERTLPAGDYYLHFQDQGAGSAGVYYLTVEDRPE